MAIVTGGACAPEAERQAAEVIRPAKLVRVSAAGNSIQVRFPAVVNAATSADLTFPVGGQIQEFAVNEGEDVRLGQLIARLEQRNFRNDVATAQATLDGAQLEFERAERLVAQDAIARNVFQQRRTARDVAQAQLDSARKALDDSTLLSPFEGVIALKHAKVLEVVQPSQPIVTLETVGAAEAIVQIPATLVAHSGQIRPITTNVVLDAAPDVRIPAELKATNAKADEATQTFQVKFGFVPPASLLILPGMTGTVESLLDISGAAGRGDQVEVPLGAVLANEDERYVWLVNLESMTVSRRDVVVGEGIGAELAIKSGLEEGDTVVAAGASYLHEGMKIRAYDQ